MDDYTKKKDEHVLNEGEWNWINYIEKGKLRDDLFKEHCPKTTQLLSESVGSRLMLGTPFSYTFFSIMKPGTKINAHYGPSNIRLRCHFPIYSNESAKLTIADHEVNWKAG